MQQPRWEAQALRRSRGEPVRTGSAVEDRHPPDWCRRRMVDSEEPTDFRRRSGCELPIIGPDRQRQHQLPNRIRGRSRDDGSRRSHGREANPLLSMQAPRGPRGRPGSPPSRPHRRRADALRRVRTRRAITSRSASSADSRPRRAVRTPAGTTAATPCGRAPRPRSILLREAPPLVPRAPAQRRPHPRGRASPGRSRPAPGPVRPSSP